MEALKMFKHRWVLAACLSARVLLPRDTLAETQLQSKPVSQEQSSRSGISKKTYRAGEASAANLEEAKRLLRVVTFYDQQGNFKRSIPLLERVVQLQPRNLEAYKLLGIDLFHIGQAAQALKPLRIVVGVNPKDDEANFYLGLCYLALDRVDDARRSYARVAADAPANIDELYFLVRGYSYLSSAMLSRLESVGKNTYRWHEIGGDYYALKWQWKAAIEEYQAAIKLSPDLPSLHYVLGNAYWQDSQLDNAAAEFQRAIKLDPQHYLARFKLAMVLLEQNKPADASRQLRKALDEQPGLVNAYVWLGKALYLQGQYKAAVPILRHYIEMAPHDPTAHYLLYEIYRRLNDATDAEKEIKLFNREKAPERNAPPKN